MSFARHSAHFLFSGRTLCGDIEQPASRQHHIGESEQREELGRVLCQAPIAHLAIVKEVLHHVEGMHDVGANAGLGVLALPQQLAQGLPLQGFALSGAQSHMPARREFQALFARPNALVAEIPEHVGLLAVQEYLGLRHVTDIRGSADHGMRQAGLGIGTDTRSNSEMPPVPFPHTMQFCILFAFPVSVEGRRGDPGSINNGTFP